MKKIKTVKIKNEDGSIGEESYFLSTDANIVNMKNGYSVEDTIGNINIEQKGNIANQLNNLNNNVNSLNNDIDNLNNNIEKKVYYFNTVADMKNADLKNGDSVITLGYYEINDGGGSEYTIVDETINDNYYETLNNNKFAKLNINGIANILQYGVSINNEDNTTQLNNAFRYNTALEGFLGTVNVKGSLIISHAEICYDFKLLTINVNSDEIIDELISIYSISPSIRVHGVFKNLIIENNGKVNESLCIYDTRRLLFENLRVNASIEHEIAIKGGKVTHNANVVLRNIRCTNGRYTNNLTQCENCVALYFYDWLSDSYINNFASIEYSVHIHNGAFNWYNMIHCWNFSYVSNSIMFETYYSIFLDNIYCDTVETLVSATGGAEVVVNNARYSYYSVPGVENLRSKPFIIDQKFINNYGKLKISNSVFINPNNIDEDLITLPITSQKIWRLNAINITNTNIGNYKIQHYYMDYYTQTLNLDFDDYDGITYLPNTITSAQMTTIKGTALFNIQLYSTGLNLQLQTYKKVCKINDILLIQANRSMIGYIVDTDNGITTVTWRINTNNEIEVRLLNNIPSPNYFSLYLTDASSLTMNYNN